MEGMVDAYAQYISTRGSMPYVPPLVELTAELLGRISEEDFLSMNPVILDSNLWKWTRIPYTTFRAALNKGSSNDPKIDERIDEWVLSNEKWLRHRTTDVPWQCGLVTLNRSDVVFPSSVLTPSGRTITRPRAFPGFEVLGNGARHSGSVPDSGLGFLKLWNSSDIDLNSKTITFYAHYPLRRIQVVLKIGTIAKRLRRPLLELVWIGIDNFVAGCNVFTMGLVRGHYLSERRASHPQRIFKYANRGYGIRFLPSYISSLRRSAEEIETLCPGGNLSSLDIDRLATDARAWVVEKFTELRGSDRIRQSRLGFISYEDTVRASLIASGKHSPSFLQYDDNPNNVASPPETGSTPIVVGLRGHGIRQDDELDGAQRMTYASHLEILLDDAHNIKIPVLLPCDFAAYANALVHAIEGQSNEAPILRPVTQYAYTDLPGEREGLYMWNTTSSLMWQHQDRRLDELFEVLQAFQRANASINEDLQVQRLVNQFSKREIRTENEFDAFFRWIGQPA
ncbi:hypothetical protein B0H12DRAFT_1069837 [Mycena haematopus]|nr:hypothetical protein B0H12DRAFT_1069837 [Mycena haematopus]